MKHLNAFFFVFIENVKLELFLVFNDQFGFFSQESLLLPKISKNKSFKIDFSILEKVFYLKIIM